MIELLEHNVETYKNLCEEMEKHNKVALIQATGTGKSYIISKYTEEHCHDALILVPTKAIGNQWQKLLPNAEVKTYQAMAKGIEGEYDLIVADEMHHLGSDVWGQRFIEYFLRNTEQKVIGATATEIRYLDNARDMVEEIFNGVAVRGVDLATAIDKGILPTFKYVTAYYGSEEDFDEYREKINSIEDIEQRNDISKRLEMCLQNRISIKTAMYENLSMAKHNIIVFLNGLCEIDEAVEMFTDMFPDCECNYVSSKRSNGENEASISRFQQSTKQISILLAVDMLNEGVHIEGVDACVMFRNTESPQVYFQQMGRALDTNGGSDRVIFDFACNAKSIKANISDNEEVNTIRSINAKIRDKKKKIILKTYEEDVYDIFRTVNEAISMHLTEHQKKFILENTNKTASELSKILGKDISSICKFCKKNGIVLSRGGRLFSEDQKRYIRNHTDMTYTELSKALAVSYDAIRAFCDRNGIVVKKNKNVCLRLSEEQKHYIRNHTDMTYKDVSEKIGISEQTVRNYCYYNAIQMNKKKEIKKMQKEEIDFIKNNASNMTSEDIAKHLGRTPSGIRQYCKRNGIDIKKRVKTERVDEKRILELYQDIKSIKKIAKITGYSTKKIAPVLRENGIVIKNYGRFQPKKQCE